MPDEPAGSGEAATPSETSRADDAVRADDAARTDGATRADDATRALPVIYLALAGGVALFATLLLVVFPDPGGESRMTFRLVWLAAAGAGLLAGRVIRARFERRDGSAADGMRAAVVVWALAEGPAFVGLVFYLLTGDRVLLLAALAAFAWAMLRNPPGAFRPRPGR